MSAPQDGVLIHDDGRRRRFLAQVGPDAHDSPSRDGGVFLGKEPRRQLLGHFLKPDIPEITLVAVLPLLLHLLLLCLLLFVLQAKASLRDVARLRELRSGVL